MSYYRNASKVFQAFSLIAGVAGLTLLVFNSFVSEITPVFWSVVLVAIILVHVPVRLSPIIAFQGMYPLLFFLVYSTGHPVAWVAAIVLEVNAAWRDHPRHDFKHLFFAAARMAAICAYLEWAGAATRDLNEFASYPVHFYAAAGLVVFISLFNWVSLAIFRAHKLSRYIATTGISYDLGRYGILALFMLILSATWEVAEATNSYLPFWVTVGLTVAIQLVMASWQESEERTKLIKRALVNLIDWRDRYAGSRSAAQRELCVGFARFLKWSPRRIDAVNSAALLHEVGKVSIPDAILHKQEKLTAEEFEIVKKHVEFRAGELEKVPGYKEVALAVLDHHERWDGKGYPAGKKEGEISTAGQPLMLCDSFVSMTSARPFRPGMSRENALSAIEKDLGTQYSPQIGAEFLKFMRSGGEPLDHLIFFPVRPS